MADVHANIKAAPVEVRDKIADAMEARAAEPRQREIFQKYIARVIFPENAEVLEIGCGTGAITRQLAAIPRLGRHHRPRSLAGAARARAPAGVGHRQHPFRR